MGEWGGEGGRGGRERRREGRRRREEEEGGRGANVVNFVDSYLVGETELWVSGEGREGVEGRG